jgi:DNA modification methylase
VRDWRILVGDVLKQLATLPDASIHCCVTSPPYWGLRDYGTGTWEGGDADCNHIRSNMRPDHSGGTITGRGTQASAVNSATPYKTACLNCGAARIDQQIGLEKTPEEFVAKMVAVFREVRRVMRPDGTLWINLGDSHSSKPGQRGMDDTVGWKQASNAGSRSTPSRSVPTLKPKDLVGIPWMVAFALRADGWYLRQDIIWAKPNPMPESVIDRCTKAHEYIFLMSKSERYYYDQEAIKERASASTHARLAQNVAAQIGSARAHGGKKSNGNMKAVGRNSRIHVNRDPRHPTRRKMGEHAAGIKANESFNDSVSLLVEWRNKRDVWEVGSYPFTEAHFATFPPDLVKPCILAGCPVGGTVLDPFSGAGTTGLVAIRHHRKYIGIELNPEYAAMSEHRLANDAPLFNGACDNAVVSEA